MLQIPEATTEGVLQKKVFFKLSKKFTGSSCARGNTYEFCKVFKNNFFKKQLWTTASEMQTLQ